MVQCKNKQKFSVEIKQLYLAKERREGLGLYIKKQHVFYIINRISEHHLRIVAVKFSK